MHIQIPIHVLTWIPPSPSMSAIGTSSCLTTQPCGPKKSFLLLIMWILKVLSKAPCCHASSRSWSRCFECIIAACGHAQTFKHAMPHAQCSLLVSQKSLDWLARCGFLPLVICSHLIGELTICASKPSICLLLQPLLDAV